MAAFLRSVKTAVLYCGLSREDYEKISPLIAERNFSFADIISVAMIIFGLIFLINQLLAGASILFPYYFLIASGMLLLVAGRTMMKKTDRRKMLYRYLQICVVFAFAMILSAQGSNREQPSVSIIVFLALLPLTINDRPVRMFAVVYGAAVAYLICSSQVKVHAVFKADVMNTLTFTTLGMAVYLLISNRNIHEIYLRQQAIESDRLREKMRAAEMANAAKSEFLANMSHEIRTPINAVLGLNETILRESLRARDALPKERETIRGIFADISSFAGNIDSAGNNLLSIINDILDFSKIEAGRLQIVEADYKLSSVLNDVCNMIAFKARDKGLDFSIDVDASLPDGLCGDKVRVRQIITNVLNNAVKYTKEGSVRFSICGYPGVRPTVGEQIVLTITVQDTGIGIRQEDIGKLFQKFERVDLEINSTVEGTGLGLAITRSLLDMMGGSIGIQSTYGEGSIFTITLPQMVVSTEPVGDFEEKFRRSLLETRAYRESFRAPDACVLIVDDTRMNLTVAVNLLKGTQIQIDTAGSGAESMALCETKCYDLILMDQRMPEMDGIEAMHRIHEQPDGKNRETPFICLTADAIRGARERYLAEGFVDYLTKPIDSQALERMLLKYLPAEKVRVETASKPVGEGKAAGTADEFEDLRALGIDPHVGLQYCQNDAEIYRSMLIEYAQNATGKLDDLCASFEQENWNAYATAVHALKSTSKMVGATALSKAAGRLEAAADVGDSTTVRVEHGRLCTDCVRLCDGIRDFFGTEEKRTNVPSDDEILEFLPEE